MKTTEQRLATLEREVRTYRTVLLSVFVGVIALVMIAAVQDKQHKQVAEKVIECDVLRAKRIELREAKAPRASILKSGGLTLVDKRGVERFSVSATDERTVLRIRSASGKNEIRLLAWSNGNCFIHMMDKLGEPRASMTNEPLVILKGKKFYMNIGTDFTGTPKFVVVEGEDTRNAVFK